MSASPDVPTTATLSYPSKAPGRKRSTRRSNPRPCTQCKQSRLKCNALPPFANGTCERCSVKRLPCEQPVVESRPSNSDARHNLYTARSSRTVSRRRSLATSSTEDRRSIAESSAQVIPPRQNIAISQEGPPNLLRQTTPDLPTDGLPALQAMTVANYFSPPTPPTQPVAEAPTEGYLTPQAMIVPTYFSPPTAYQSLMGGGLTYSFVTNYDIPLGSLEIPIGPLLDQYGYTAWNHTTTDGDDYAGVE